jgi:hypothetical protein
MIERRFTLFADYFQFYLQDEGARGIDGASWTEAAVVARLALERDAFAVSTARNMDVPVEVVICDAEPDLDLSGWDHVVAFSVDFPSGQVIVAGCTDYRPDAERMNVPPGRYAARVLYANLDRLSPDGLDGEDFYRVELWPGAPSELRVLKRQPDPV